MTLPIRIGTRGSPLALAQAREARDRLTAAWPDLREPDAVEIVVIRTTGDTVTDRPLADIGGKGLFTKEIDEALLSGRISLAVHSAKDVPTWLPDGLAIAGYLPREDPRDAVIGTTEQRIAGLPSGAVVGTGSLRRQAQLLARRPDVRVVPIRGNVDTRIAKVADGRVAATFLAMAGLNRLGRTDAGAVPLEPGEMIPAPGQGAIAVVTCTDDDDLARRLRPLTCATTTDSVNAERALLATLDGSCRTPIAALATIEADDRLDLIALVARADGSELYNVRLAGDRSDAVRIGRDAGERLLARIGKDFFP